MKTDLFDFETLPDRRGRDAIALDLIGAGAEAPGAPREGFDPIPMWVADMNFVGCPSVQEAILERATHSSFGYFNPSREYYDAILRWQQSRNQVSDLEDKHIGYENGVLGGVLSALNVLCSRGDKVLVHRPTYIGFTKTLSNNGYQLIHSDLTRDAQGIWRMDLEDMERKIQEHHIHATIFCSPHNPCGRVWTREEIQAAMALFEKYEVWVISDEIWSDIMLNGHHHIPTQSVSEYAHQHTAAMYAPSKTFNLAGLVGSYHIIYNDWLRDRVDKESSLSAYNNMNVLSMHALIGAYSETGAAWTDQLCQVLSRNVNNSVDTIHDRFPGIDVMKPEGTYMLFLQCQEWCTAHGATMDELLRRGTDVGVGWQDGRMFGDPWGIRMNLALPTSSVKEAFRRLEQYVFM